MSPLPDPTKRRFPRYKYEAPVGIAVLRGTTPVNITGVCMVLGEGGAGVRTSQHLSIDEIVYVQIALPHRPLRLPATVRNQRGTDYGVEFIALGATELEYIRTTCSSFPRVG